MAAAAASSSSSAPPKLLVSLEELMEGGDAALTKMMELPREVLIKFKAVKAGESVRSGGAPTLKDYVIALHVRAQKEDPPSDRYYPLLITLGQIVDDEPEPEHVVGGRTPMLGAWRAGSMGIPERAQFKFD
jgi:hypothetical protein